VKGFKQFLCVMLFLGVSTSTFSDTHYVRAGWTNPVYPYTNWITASTSILSAAGATVNGDTVIVSNGTYQHYAQIGIANAITLKSVNGWSNTVIDGAFAILAAPMPLLSMFSRRYMLAAPRSAAATLSMRHPSAKCWHSFGRSTYWE
jgi:hypothetical protein